MVRNDVEDFAMGAVLVRVMFSLWMVGMVSLVSVVVDFVV